MEREFEPDIDPTPIPKLSLFSLPSHGLPEPPGMCTPPPRSAQASVPFLWEEAPGKPRPTTTTTGVSKASSARCLELPPRLFFTEAKITNLPSPTTVLDGPYVGRSASCTATFGRDRDGSSLFDTTTDGLRFGSIFHSKRETKGKGSYLSSSGRKILNGIGENDGNNKVKITRFRRSGSLFNLSLTRSHLWANISESFKQVVPWRNGRKTKKNGLSM
ncbi:PREDICTED: uncharacterized protein At4g00950 [Nelumbo nucifera]|uniref:Uncharacterized protein At4g00950 n=1 Tax=Nelumbo nucifera TaxID=4432 RepID=A0A1U8AN67_NELNU|nr:PREDICTED: uncharacterized protein At4g00950 [Nelumbo nucifera]